MSRVFFGLAVSALFIAPYTPQAEQALYAFKSMVRLAIGQ